VELLPPSGFGIRNKDRLEIICKFHLLDNTEFLLSQILQLGNLSKAVFISDSTSTVVLLCNVEAMEATFRFITFYELTFV
jgi:hypothetical protein